jgi:hypothetical protein
MYPNYGEIGKAIQKDTLPQHLAVRRTSAARGRWVHQSAICGSYARCNLQATKQMCRSDHRRCMPAAWGMCGRDLQPFFSLHVLCKMHVLYALSDHQSCSVFFLIVQKRIFSL